MNVQILKKSATELVIKQQKKLTITGSLFCGPATILLFFIPVAPGLLLLSTCILLWMIALYCFFRGVTYTFRADRSADIMELSVKGVFASRNHFLRFEDIHHIIMGERSPVFNRTGDFDYQIIFETNRSRYKFFGFKDRDLCKNTIALMDSYLYTPVAAIEYELV